MLLPDLKLDLSNCWAIGGRMGAGKSTVAKWLIEERICNVKYGFAGSVREVASMLFPDIKKSSIRRRYVLQNIGAKMREIDSDVWVKKLLRELDWTYRPRPATVVIDDLRYPNEMEALLDRGCRIILLDIPERIRRDRITKRDKLDPGLDPWRQWKEHESERAFDQLKEIFYECKSDEMLMYHHHEDHPITKASLMRTLHELHLL